MKTKIIILVFLALWIVPVGGCRVRKHYKEQLKVNAKIIRDRDSMRVTMRDSMRTLSLVRNTLAETVSRMDKISAEHRSENLNIEKRTVTEPVKIPGKTFKTTVTGNFMLDTSAIRDGKLVYFDIDNEDVRVTAYSENGQMKALVETKEKTINVPVNEVRITQSKEASKSSSDKSTKEEKVIDNKSLQEMTQVLNSDSGQVKEAEQTEVKAETKSDKKVTTGPAWGTVLTIAGAAIIAVFLIWQLWLKKIF